MTGDLAARAAVGDEGVGVGVAQLLDALMGRVGAVLCSSWQHVN
jgi:hypothetical protein